MPASIHNNRKVSKVDSRAYLPGCGQMLNTGHMSVGVFYVAHDGTALSRQFLEQQMLVQLTRQRAGDEDIIGGKVDVV